MKKIMFNDRFGLTKAVLEGRKTMTRRIIKAPKTMEGQLVSGFAICKRPGSDEVAEVMALDEDGGMINNILPKYKVGEVVAVAQNAFMDGVARGYGIKQKEQKPAEWSEEAEKDIQEASKCLRDYANKCVQGENSKLYIQSLADRIESLLPRPEQDILPSLSDKEIICLKRTLDYLRKEHGRYEGEDFTNEIVVLEWLITHPILVSDPHWKPSEEQMKALLSKLPVVKGGGDKIQDILESLYDDLKKLM